MKNLTQKQITEYIEKLRRDRNYHGLLTDASFPKGMSQKEYRSLSGSIKNTGSMTPSYGTSTPP